MSATLASCSRGMHRDRQFINKKKHSTNMPAPIWLLIKSLFLNLLGTGQGAAAGCGGGAAHALARQGAGGAVGLCAAAPQALPADRRRAGRGAGSAGASLSLFSVLKLVHLKRALLMLIVDAQAETQAEQVPFFGFYFVILSFQITLCVDRPLSSSDCPACFNTHHQAAAWLITRIWGSAGLDGAGGQTCPHDAVPHLCISQTTTNKRYCQCLAQEC